MQSYIETFKNLEHYFLLLKEKITIKENVQILDFLELKRLKLFRFLVSKWINLGKNCSLLINELTNLTNSWKLVPASTRNLSLLLITHMIVECFLQALIYKDVFDNVLRNANRNYLKLKFEWFEKKFNKLIPKFTTNKDSYLNDLNFFRNALMHSNQFKGKPVAVFWNAGEITKNNELSDMDIAISEVVLDSQSQTYGSEITHIRNIIQLCHGSLIELMQIIDKNI